jgi:hypothetical protein
MPASRHKPRNVVTILVVCDLGWYLAKASLMVAWLSAAGSTLSKSAAYALRMASASCSRYSGSPAAAIARSRDVGRPSSSVSPRKLSVNAARLPMALGTPARSKKSLVIRSGRFLLLARLKTAITFDGGA